MIIFYAFICILALVIHQILYIYTHTHPPTTVQDPSGLNSVSPSFLSFFRFFNQKQAR